MMPAHTAQDTGGLYLRTQLSCHEATQRTRRALSDVGFRFLTEIDVNASLKTSLHQFMAHYRILGADAAMPETATPIGHARLADTPQDWGLALPCSVDVFVDPHTGDTVVTAADPDTLIMEFGQRAMVAAQNENIRAKLEAAFARLTMG